MTTDYTKVFQDADAVDKFNASDRICPACGKKQEPFPQDIAGWRRYAQYVDLANRAREQRQCHRGGSHHRSRECGGGVHQGRVLRRFTRFERRRRERLLGSSCNDSAGLRRRRVHRSGALGRDRWARFRDRLGRGRCDARWQGSNIYTY